MKASEGENMGGFADKNGDGGLNFGVKQWEWERMYGVLF